MVYATLFIVFIKAIFIENKYIIRKLIKGGNSMPQTPVSWI